MVHPGPQALQGEILAKSKTRMMIIKSLVCQPDINEFYCIFSNTLLKRATMCRNIQGRRINVEKVFQTSIILDYIRMMDILYGTTSVLK